jgi:hypothetical protein
MIRGLNVNSCQPQPNHCGFPELCWSTCFKQDCYVDIQGMCSALLESCRHLAGPQRTSVPIIFLSTLMLAVTDGKGTINKVSNGAMPTNLAAASGWQATLARGRPAYLLYHCEPQPADNDCWGAFRHLEYQSEFKIGW